MPYMQNTIGQGKHRFVFSYLIWLCNQVKLKLSINSFVIMITQKFTLLLIIGFKIVYNLTID